MDDDVPSKQTIKWVVSIINTNETGNFLTNYFANHREISEKTLFSVPLKERNVIAAEGQNINATRSSKKGNNDICDNPKENWFEASINDDTSLSKFARRRNKIKDKQT